MTYKLAFNESALKEWKKLGHTIQEQFKKKLRERLENPRVPASQLHGRKDQYKIKLFALPPYPNWTAVGVTWLAGFDFEIKVIARIP
ncbi:TPA: type II toxin-antitoxin system RelE/ParE family toxin [Salmonella enterica subsp. enterica]